MQTTDYDNIVVGAGPAGSYLAYLLADSGHRVLVLEKERNIGKVVCTGIVSEDCLSLTSSDHDIALRLANSATFFSPYGKSLRVYKDGLKVYILDRPGLDLKMANLAQKKGAHFQLGSKVTEINRKNGHMEVQVRRNGDATTSISGRAIAIANGFGSNLPQKVGMGKMRDFVMGAQVEVRTSGITEVEVYFDQDIATGFFAWLVPLSGDKGLVGLFSTRDVAQQLKTFVAHLVSSGKISNCTSEASYGGIPLQPLSKTYDDGIVVLGDAAGQVKPTTGGGIYYGLISSALAAKALHNAAISERYSADILSQYEKDWKKKLAWELKMDYWARSLYRRLNNSHIESLFELAKNRALDRLILDAEDFSFDWHGPIIRRALSHDSMRLALQVLFKTFLSKQKKRSTDEGAV